MRYLYKAENFSPTVFAEGVAADGGAPVTICKGEIISGSAIFVVDRAGATRKVRVENRIGNCTLTDRTIGL